MLTALVGVRVLRAGAASTIITPPAGLDMEGYLRVGPSEGVLDELTCQAVVYEGRVCMTYLTVQQRLAGLQIRPRGSVTPPGPG